MTSEYIGALRAQLLEAAAREQDRRWPPRVAVRLRVLAVAAVAIAALVVGVSALDLRSDERVAKPPPPERLTGRPLFGGSLEPGVRYVTRKLDPQISFEVSDGTWFVRDATGSDSLALERRRGANTPGAETGPLAYLFFERIVRVTDPGTGRAVAAPRDLLAWLRRHPDLRAGESGRTTVAGRPARFLETTVAFTRPAQRDRVCEARLTTRSTDPNAPLPLCMKLTPDIGLPNGVRTRWIVLDVGGRPFMIEIEGWGKGPYDRVLGPAGRVLDSLQIGR